MTNVSDIYTLWLKPRHLPTDKPVSVTVAQVEKITVHPRPTEERDVLVLGFANNCRKLILNSTNANTMADIGGEDWTAWRGLVIQLKRQKFTKDKETINILPSSTTASRVSVEAPKPAQAVQVIDAPAQPAKTNGDKHEAPAKPNGNGDNGHTEKTDKPYQFPSTAAKNFWNEAQKATDNFYQKPTDLVEAIGGWFNFGSSDLWSEKMSFATDHARMMRESAQEPVVESQE